MERKRRFSHWAYLNEEGMRLWGDVFPDGRVPLVSMIPQVASLRDTPSRAYMVYIPELQEEQFEAILSKLQAKFNAPKEVIRKALLESGLPLRASLVSSSGTNHMGLLL